MFSRITEALKIVPKIKHILGFTSGGIHKRIDENRELLELLQREAPQLLAKHFWVEGWLRSNDEFFNVLAKTVPIEQGAYLSAAIRSPERFPRPWPEALMRISPEGPSSRKSE